MLAHILQLPKKGVADLCLCQLATMYVQMHVKIFSLQMIYTVDSKIDIRYVIKRHTRAVNMMIKMTIK